MKLRVVTVRLDPDSGLFDDEELVALQETGVIPRKRGARARFPSAEVADEISM